MVSLRSAALQMSGRRSHAHSLPSSPHTDAAGGTVANSTCHDALDNDLTQGVENGRGGIFDLGVPLCNLRLVGGVHGRWRILPDASHKLFSMADLLSRTAAGRKWETGIRFRPEIHNLSQYNHALRSMKLVKKQWRSMREEISCIETIIDQMRHLQRSLNPCVVLK